MNKLRITLPDGTPLTQDLAEDRVTIGRLPENDLQIEDDSVSSHHGEITYDGNAHQLTDLGSTNGTFVNGAQVTEATLQTGDQVRFGQIDCVYEGEKSAPGSAPMPDSGSATVALGDGSARPPGFASASPFPKLVERDGPIAKVAVAFAVLGALGFAAAVYMTLQMQIPA
jgi:predicted component of type VI protein secretion system